MKKRNFISYHIEGVMREKGKYKKNETHFIVKTIQKYLNSIC